LAKATAVWLRLRLAKAGWRLMLPSYGYGWLRLRLRLRLTGWLRLAKAG
jgi:hypothetical protein